MSGSTPTVATASPGDDGGRSVPRGLREDEVQTGHAGQTGHVGQPGRAGHPGQASQDERPAQAAQGRERALPPPARHGAARMQPLLGVAALVLRRGKGLFRRARALWRRSIQLRVVATTLLLSLGVVLLLGVVVINQVRNGLLDAKVQTARSQAASGFETAQLQLSESGANRTAQSESGQASSAAGGGQGGSQLDMGTWLTQVTQRSSGAGDYSVVAMVPPSATSAGVSDSAGSSGAAGSAGGAGGVDSSGIRGPRTSNDVVPSSVPESMQEALASTGQQQEAYTQIVRETGSGQQTSTPGIVIGRQLSGPDNQPYQLYFLFPFQEDSKTLGLVTETLAIAGVFVVILLGAIAWLVVRQVVAPVRIAAGISERLAAGRLEERMKVSGTDDIARLGESFNKMAAALQTQIRQLKELSRMQRRFVSDVSHELRTPLTTVRMAADLLYEAREDFADASSARSAELLQTQLDRFESLLADLLEISRFDAGAAVLEAEPVDLREVVQRVVESADPLARVKGSQVLVVGDERAAVAEIDPRRIERVLRNLVVNALEHGEGRDVVVRIAASEEAVAVGVRDHGIGLKPGEASRVFHRFWRADPARARTTGGTGLGLSIALEDANLHGGWLQAWGEPGGGSQFRLTLPRSVGAELRRSPMPLEPEDSRGNRGLGASGVPFQRRAIAGGARSAEEPKAQPPALPGGASTTGAVAGFTGGPAVTAGPAGTSGSAGSAGNTGAGGASGAGNAGAAVAPSDVLGSASSWSTGSQLVVRRVGGQQQETVNGGEARRDAGEQGERGGDAEHGGDAGRDGRRVDAARDGAAGDGESPADAAAAGTPAADGREPEADL
ncbi:MtrAB system histidine kinase MtrB [Phaeacidiphilus oryzae]|uniref:MtrAB system histidine kinase MtrB n=1 Tax=Phaeacidiphilus oryzae TaxID=348818 RepID=UPI00068E8D9A|nr:MtrAB system histidine kinase MtrB [Phaeacidiphilus oryzae]